ncbi:hypothetical protein L249_0755 [Ophiocordyceps polyrhachis-furcata BCC 54312]|uniref:RRM domain-containing protein n=1 Tax=Ophiocordyceps polyrhachis-furcata BCC 54312 TaxID=1330021 RepID=A0A367LCG4_9HYPO|nr:hypothetical protein L249_0755 [Ophiocordyceps polyrhachis-furcata BCC 54312]
MNKIRAIQALNQKEIEQGVSTEGSWHTDFRDTAYIYFGGLPYELSEGDVITIFSQFGEPVFLKLARDKETGKSRGFGWLKYHDQRSTDLAVDNLGGADIGGRLISVDHARYKPRDDEDPDEFRVGWEDMRRREGQPRRRRRRKDVSAFAAGRTPASRPRTGPRRRRSYEAVSHRGEEERIIVTIAPLIDRDDTMITQDDDRGGTVRLETSNGAEMTGTGIVIILQTDNGVGVEHTMTTMMTTKMERRCGGATLAATSGIAGGTTTMKARRRWVEHPNRGGAMGIIRRTVGGEIGIVEVRDDRDGRAKVDRQVVGGEAVRRVPSAVVAVDQNELFPPRVLAGTDDGQAVITDPPDDTLGRSRRSQYGALVEGDATDHGVVAGLEADRSEGVDIGEDTRHEGNLAQNTPFPGVALCARRVVLGVGVGDVEDVKSRLVGNSGRIDAAAQLGDAGAVGGGVDADEGTGLASASQQLAVGAELDRLEGRRVSRDDTDVARRQVHDLHLA